MAKFLITVSSDTALLLVQGLDLLSKQVSSEMHSPYITLLPESEQEYLIKLDRIDEIKRKLVKYFDL